MKATNLVGMIVAMKSVATTVTAAMIVAETTTAGMIVMDGVLRSGANGLGKGIHLKQALQALRRARISLETSL